MKWLTVAIFMKWQDCSVAIWLDNASEVWKISSNFVVKNGQKCVHSTKNTLSSTLLKQRELAKNPYKTRS